MTAPPINPDMQVPRSFYCPLTEDIMMEPVLDNNGTTYERVAIEAWLQHFKTLPETNQSMLASSLIPNKAMQDVIHGFMGTEWADERKKVLPNGSTREFIANTRGADTERRRIRYYSNCPNRHEIDDYLEEISNAIHFNLQLDDTGTCAFQYMGLEFRINVGEQATYFSICCQPLVDEVTQDMKERILRLNHFQTHGACLYLRNEAGRGEILKLVFIKRISEVTCSKFKLILEDFLGTAVWLKTFLLEPARSDRRPAAAHQRQHPDAVDSASLPRQVSEPSTSEDDKQKRSPGGSDASGRTPPSSDSND